MKQLLKRTNDKTKFNRKTDLIQQLSKPKQMFFNQKNHFKY